MRRMLTTALRNRNWCLIAPTHASLVPVFQRPRSGFDGSGKWQPPPQRRLCKNEIISSKSCLDNSFVTRRRCAFSFVADLSGSSRRIRWRRLHNESIMVTALTTPPKHSNLFWSAASASAEQNYVSIVQTAARKCTSPFNLLSEFAEAAWCLTDIQKRRINAKLINWTSFTRH